MKTRPLYRFFLMVLLTISGILLMGYLRPEPISSIIQKEKFWATKVHSNKKYDVIVAGDSRVYRGIDPVSISEELSGLEVLNFGFSSGGHNPLIFKEIEKRLRSGGENGIIILGLTPYSLTKKAQKNSHFTQENDRNPKEVFFRRYVNPTLNFFDPVKPTELIYANNISNGYFEIFSKDGWVESKKIPYNEEAALKGYVKDFKNNEVDDKVIEKMIFQVRKWTNQGIQVFAIRIPTTEKMEMLENELSNYNESLLKHSFESHGGKWISIKNRYGYSSYDGSHLDGESAKNLSSYIGKQVSQSLK